MAARAASGLTRPPSRRRSTLKNETGLDHYQVRTWRAWYAHITLSMLALAWLAASRLSGKWGTGTIDPGMIGYTLPEIRGLLISLVQACSPDPEGVWS